LFGQIAAVWRVGDALEARGRGGVLSLDAMCSARLASRALHRITITGPNREGALSQLLDAASRGGAVLADVESMALHGRIHLELWLDFGAAEPATSDAWNGVRAVAHAHELHAELAAAESAQPLACSAPTWALTVLARPIDAQLLAAIAATTQTAGFQIVRIERLSNAELTSAELLLRGPAGEPERALRGALFALRGRHACDLALQPETLTRRNKRLIVMDMDSTLIQQEVIDEIAVALNVKDKVSAITERAMNGELDFDQSLRERVRLLRGTPVGTLVDVLARIQLTPGAEELVRVLKRLGYRTAVISGGFMEIVEPIKESLGLDYAFANRLEVRDGLLTGEVLGTIVNRRRKAELLEQIALQERIALDQVIAVGDGANDLDMLHKAGLGIAFNAKRAVQEQAATAINQSSLLAILYLLGIRDTDALAFGAG
jgi:phosphoserine phosphatase